MNYCDEKKSSLKITKIRTIKEKQTYVDASNYKRQSPRKMIDIVSKPSWQVGVVGHLYMHDLLNQF